MQKITLTFKGEGSLRLNAHGYESIEIPKGKSHVFKSAVDYKPYSQAALAWKDIGLEILIEDVKEEVKEAKPAKAKSEVKEDAKAEVKEEVKAEAKPAKAAKA